MRQDWHHLLFLHWIVPLQALRPLVPGELELDTFGGEAYVGLVPFTMSGIRPTFAPSLGPLSRAHEVNVRTYVHFRGQEPGVWFFSLDASNPLAVIGARVLFHLPYFVARMEAKVTGDDVDYFSQRIIAGRRPASCRLHYGPRAPISPAVPGTLEHFLVERYILYAQSGDRLYRGRIHHQPYPLQRAGVGHCEESLVAAAGIEGCAGHPLAHYAREVNVEVFALERISERM